MLNRKKDNKDGKYSQAVSNILDMKYREDLERMKKIRAHRGLRHYCACRARPPLLLPRRMPAADRRRRVRRSQGVCACVASAQRPRAARAAPSVSPRKRARRAPPLLTTRARRGRCRAARESVVEFAHTLLLLCAPFSPAPSRMLRVMPLSEAFLVLSCVTSLGLHYPIPNHDFPRVVPASPPAPISYFRGVFH